MSNWTIRERAAVSEAAKLLMQLSLVYFSAVSQASDLMERPVDLVNLDADSELVWHLRNSGELIRID